MASGEHNMSEDNMSEDIMSESCKTCRFWLDTSPPHQELRGGICRRHAPRHRLVIGTGERADVRGSGTGYFPAWPIVWWGEWCGEYGRKE